jgi:hypothetical protein
MSSEMPQRPIPYEHVLAGGGMTRRQGQWLIFLMLVNTVLLAVGVAGPQVGPAVRKALDDWRARRAAAAAAQQTAATRAVQRQQLIADQAQWMTHAFAPDTVIYEEDPKVAAAHLISGKGYDAVATPGVPNLKPPWQPPVIAPAPPLVKKLRGVAYASSDGVLLVHERRTPGGDAKLVCVAVQAHQRVQDVGTQSLDQRAISDVALVAIALDPATADSDAAQTKELRQWKQQTLKLIVPDHLAPVMHFTASSRPGPYEVRPGTYLRLFAGAPDPNDPTHFTIPYQLGKTSGTIDGWLRDDAIELRGRGGEMGPQSSWLLPAPKP